MASAGSRAPDLLRRRRRGRVVRRVLVRDLDVRFLRVSLHAGVTGLGACIQARKHAAIRRVVRERDDAAFHRWFAGARKGNGRRRNGGGGAIAGRRCLSRLIRCTSGLRPPVEPPGRQLPPPQAKI